MHLTIREIIQTVVVGGLLVLALRNMVRQGISVFRKRADTPVCPHCGAPITPKEE